MTAALARPLQSPSAPSRRGIAPVALRVAGSGTWVRDEVDLDAAWAEAAAPHRIAAERDAHLADVIPLDRSRARGGVSARVRRHRLVAVLFVLGLALLLALGAGALGADADGPTAVGSTVTVQPGQTLWDVAVTHTDAGDDPRAALERIRDLNGLTGTDVPAWTQVVIPASLD